MDSSGTPIPDAFVTLQSAGLGETRAQRSSERGAFEFTLTGDHYSLQAKKGAARSRVSAVNVSQTSRLEIIRLVLESASDLPKAAASIIPSQPTDGNIEFSDQPSFAISGVTDFTAVGGHGSDATLRTTEVLAAETAALKPSDTGRISAEQGATEEAALRSSLAATPASFQQNRKLGKYYLEAGRITESIPLLQAAYRIDPDDQENVYDLAMACRALGDLPHSRQYIRESLARRDNADLHRLAGELYEADKDSLGAVRELQSAVGLDPSETNLFEWGSELLVHRAIWQAREVFQRGVAAYPNSSRMLTGLGTALFSGGAYGDAARELCQASDLNPSEALPYVFMGKVQAASPDLFPCIQERLKQFSLSHPRSAQANYLYAMVLVKAHEHSPEKAATEEAASLLTRAVAIDPRYAEAYLQLGILSFAAHDYKKAIELYSKAIRMEPQLDEAYYRLAVAYNRIGDQAGAKEEFARHDEIVKLKADATERQRLEVKQFLFMLPGKEEHLQSQQSQ